MVVKWQEKREREFITFREREREREERKTIVGLRCANIGEDEGRGGGSGIKE